MPFKGFIIVWPISFVHVKTNNFYLSVSQIQDVNIYASLITVILPQIFFFENLIISVYLDFDLWAIRALISRYYKLSIVIMDYKVNQHQRHIT